MKKLLAVLVAISMIMSFALVASADENVTVLWDAGATSDSENYWFQFTDVLYNGYTEGGYLTFNSEGGCFNYILILNDDWTESNRINLTSENGVATLSYDDLLVAYQKVDTSATDLSGLNKITVIAQHWMATTYSSITWTSASSGDSSIDDGTTDGGSGDSDSDNEETVDGYTAALSYADADWSVQTWGETAYTSVDGAGTYTLSWDRRIPAEGVVVFVIDIGDAGGDAGVVLSALELSELSITVDGEEIEVDLSKVVTGDIEENGRYRIEIYNEYGDTKNASPIDVADLASIDENLTVTFTLSEPTVDDGEDNTDDEGDIPDDGGNEDVPEDDEDIKTDGTDEGVTEEDKEDTTEDKKEESTDNTDKEESSDDEEPKAPVATMNYTAGLSYADADWYPQTWGDTAYTTVTGAGSYKLSWDLTDAVDGVVVFVIDIGEEGGNAATDIAKLGLTALTLTVDGVDVPVDLSKVVTGDIEGKGRYRIEIYNEYGTTKDDSPVDVTALKAAENITVNFTLGTVSDSSNSKTGDSTNLVAMAAAMILAATGVAVTVSKKKEF